MTFSRPVINQSACGIYLSHIIIPRKVQFLLSLKLMYANMNAGCYSGVEVSYSG